MDFQTLTVQVSLGPGEDILALSRPRPHPRPREVRRVTEYADYEPPRRPERPRRLIERVQVVQPTVEVVYPYQMQWVPPSPPLPLAADYMSTIQLTQTNLQVVRSHLYIAKLY